eukprot:13266623-Alexandrium_andersonii.AAC.1
MRVPEVHARHHLCRRQAYLCSPCFAQFTVTRGYRSSVATLVEWTMVGGRHWHGGGVAEWHA